MQIRWGSNGWVFHVAVCALAAVLLAPASVQATITLGQVDDFQDGTVEDWNGANGYFINVGSGQGGAADRYLRVDADQPGGQGSKVATYNANDWSGDYIAAGVNGVQVDMVNLGATDLDMRVLLLFGAGGEFTTTTPLVVPADGVWRTYTFGLTASDLTQVSGAGTLNDTLSTVGRLMFRHQSGSPQGVGGGTTVAGTLGLDNITAVPEPATLTLLALGGLFAARRRR